MSLAQVASRALLGMEAPPVTVEVHLSPGLPGFTIVGLPEAEVREARDRVRSALINSGLGFPSNRRIVVNLAPADLPKESGRFDLPIAIGLLAAQGLIPPERLRGHTFAGELSLTGALRPTRGALAMACALGATQEGDAAESRLVLPQASAAEAALAQAGTVLGADDLQQVVAYLLEQDGAAQPVTAAAVEISPADAPDMAEVRGHSAAKRALEIAAAGGHHVLMVGPPGSGKSMLAQRFAGLLPPMTREQALESATVLSLVGRFDPAQWGRRFVRSPHHTASAVALVGGGAGTIRPGEISLATQNILFLDELPEFDRAVLESLREPLETGRIHISRAARQAEFPARFQLIAAMNPCPCGYLGHATKACRCTPDQVSRYQGRVSGPLLDRIDIQVEVGAIAPDALLQMPQGETSAQIAARVAVAAERQQARQGKLNARLQGAELDVHCALDAASGAFLTQAITRLGWSSRAAHRVLRLARTIADLAGSEHIALPHLAEALQLRRALTST
ncbi:MAG: YifB family Mg chelatase-like AAA ATPase [Thiomonas sp.]|uniref:YifB family Mg chelatase-like AAA ATPase n=1 Tax=Thiomonas sp. TaxID=2047785 RepID=UPI002A35D89A|nr:YifB family Mg chelatase-like AAA ATPase [Thiomonas sp.]MDY0331322.1 YifB family Mg chelatase-like AAA ATPase [Thiomonas sp.]